MSSAVYDLDSLKDDQNDKLNKALQDITCIVQIATKDKKNPYQKFCFAGFCIHPSGLFMSCAHPLSRCDTRDIKIRMLKDNVFYNVVVVHMQPSWDIVLLKITKTMSKSANNNKDYKFGKFASNGSLTEGQILVHMGHSMTGSYFIGRVSSPCVQNVILPPLNDPATTCRLYNPNGYQNIVVYKTMGHIYNKDFCKSLKVSDRKNHHANIVNPLVPIVEFSGFTPSPGSLGGPIFNTQGEIVGMVAGVEVESFAIHVTALRHIFEAYDPGAAANIKDDLAMLQKKKEENEKKGGAGGSGLKK